LKPLGDYTGLRSLPFMPFLMAWLKCFPSPVSGFAPSSESPNMTLNSLFSTVREKNGETQIQSVEFPQN